MGAATDVGRVRDGNEDAYLVDDAMGLVAVADGMGGHRAGEVASATALEALRAAVTSGRPLRESIEDANEAVFTKSLTDTSLRGMGTTLTAGTLASGGTLLVGHVGDSRAYLLHDGELRQITVDHSLVEELVARASSPPTRPRCTRSDRSSRVRSASTRRSTSTCTRSSSCPAIVSSSAPTGSPAWCSPTTSPPRCAARTIPTRAATQLVDAANSAGGEDNITVVVVAVTDEAPVRVVPEPVEPLVAVEVDDTPAPEPGERRRRGARGVGRVLLWALPIVLVLGIAVAAVGWYARKDFYVGASQGQVTVFKGVPGGLAGWDPTIEQRTTVAIDDLKPAAQAQVRDHQTFSSRADAGGVRRAAEDADHDDDDHHHEHHHDGSPDHHAAPAPGHARAGHTVKSPTARRRRSRELGLGLLAVVVTGAGYVLLLLADRPDIPADLWVFLLAVLGLYVVAHLAVRRFAPRADPTLLPIVFLLNGIGFFTISRLDRDLARVQAVWTAVGVAAFVLTLVVVRNIRTLERYQYTFLFLGVAALLLPSLPGLGQEINGARLWVRIGPLNFQPGEAAKVLLVIFFAAYLVDKRELLAAGTRHIGRVRLPDPKHLGPLLLAWGFSILVMVREKDLGSSLLFFAVFAAMLYIATERGVVPHRRARRCSSPARSSRTSCSATCRIASARGSIPWSVSQGKGFQLVQSMYALGSGGFAGTGLGLGSPQKIPNASTDFVFSAIGEELGLLGTVAVCILFLLLVGSGLRIAIQADRPFSKLFAAGLTTIIGVQTFVIIGGVIRVIPLTGVTLPFISYGGSSLIANFVIIALLLRISDETVARAEMPARARRAHRGRRTRQPRRR